MDTSTHRFEPYFESDSPCWCGRHRGHRLHDGDRPYLATPEGQLFARVQELRSAEATTVLWRAQRRNNLLSLIFRR